jgi:hypothetical protein
MSVTFATTRFAAAGVAASARGDAGRRSTAKAAARIAGIANAESGRGRRRRNRAMYQNLLRGIPVNFTMLPRINRTTRLVRSMRLPGLERFKRSPVPRFSS